MAGPTHETEHVVCSLSRRRLQSFLMTATALILKGLSEAPSF